MQQIRRSVDSTESYAEKKKLSSSISGPLATEAKTGDEQSQEGGRMLLTSPTVDTIVESRSISKKVTNSGVQWSVTSSTADRLVTVGLVAATASTSKHRGRAGVNKEGAVHNRGGPPGVNHRQPVNCKQH